MTTVLIANQPEEVRNLLPWAAHLAASRGSDLTVLLLQRKTGETRLVDVSDEPQADDPELVVQARLSVQQLSSNPPSDETPPGQSPPVEPAADDRAAAPHDLPVRLRQIIGEHWTSDLITKVDEINPSLIVVPAPTISKEQTADEDWQTQLLTAVDCDVFLMRDDSTGVEQHIRVAVFITDEADNEAALSYASQLVDHLGGGGTATAVYVEPNISDVAESVGRRQLDNTLDRLVRSRDREAFRRKVIVAGSTTDAFRDLKADEFDLLLMGTRHLRQMRRFLQASPASGAPQGSSIPAVAVVKRGESLSSRLMNKAARRLRDIVPQLSREERVDLVSRVQDSSKWDFDFVFLMSLATLIACLGLAENSGAVIVGAMLVAPLMTPIAGVGLGVAHANAHLTKVAFRTAMRGFVTAMVIGLAFGLSVQGCAKLEWLTPLQESAEPALMGRSLFERSPFPREMESRTQPQFYDLLIALASGAAAAYAMGRRNLFSALPGVAIAAALVPPIATSGIALSHGEFTKGGGALLLFLTNMVTIILGTSLVFRTVGVRSQKAGPNAARWPRHVLLLLALLSLLITLVIESRNHSP
ncbi:MAG: DUF389 domain-containing protein [Fuerstiella sp.]|nr:DUF389 domain-containing protein [Fuerstiella sp.]